jgi:hypothetical protein
MASPLSDDVVLTSILNDQELRFRRREPHDQAAIGGPGGTSRDSLEHAPASGGAQPFNVEPRLGPVNFSGMPQE